MTLHQKKPIKGQTYYITSKYGAPKYGSVYEYVWAGSKMDLDLYMKRTIYFTAEDATAACMRGDFS